MPGVRLPDDPFAHSPRSSRWDGRPDAWDDQKPAIFLYRLGLFESDVDEIEVGGGAIRRLGDTVAAIQAVEPRRLRPVGQPTNWADFQGHPPPWIYEVGTSLREYEAAHEQAEYSRRMLESTLRINSDRFPYLDGPAAYQPDVQDSAIGTWSLQLPKLEADVPDVALCHLTALDIPNLVRISDAQGLWAVRDTKEARRIKIALRRFMLSTTRDEEHDSLIDRWVGLEALFSESPGDLAYKIPLRIAAFVGEDGGERLGMFRSLRDSYRMRSRLVHGDSNPTDLKEANRWARSALRRALRQLLLASAAPSVDAIDQVVAFGERPRWTV